MYRKIVKIFLGSPGDLGPERQAASRIAQEINRNHADFYNVQVELVGWEDTVSRFGRAQAVINQDLDQCEYFVGVMWQRWGSPPGDENHPYTSGFEEEFKRSLKRRLKTGTPEISLLFKAPEESRMQDPGKELTKVLEFKKTVIADQKVLFQEFKEIPDFEVKFRALVTDYVQKGIIAERKTEEQTEAGGKGGAEGERETTPSNPEIRLFGEEAIDFVRDLVSRADPVENVSAADLARFRLLGMAVSRSGNDSETLGVHDANLIFKNRETFKLTLAEISALLVAGAANIAHQNAPLWGWVYQAEDSPGDELVWQALIREPPLKVSLIQCLAKAHNRLDSEGIPLGRDSLLKAWLESESDDVKKATLAYLEECGTPADLSLLDETMASTDTTISEHAVVVAVMLLAETDTERALDLLERHQNSNIPPRLLKILFAHPSRLRTDRLSTLTGHRSSELRAMAIKTLVARDGLAEVTASVLLDDQNPEVRFLALQTLQKKQRKFTSDEARKILVREKNKGFGLLMGSTTEGEEFFSKFLRQSYSAFPKESLSDLVGRSEVYEYEAAYALYDKHFTEQFGEIERNLEDVFVAEFGRRLQNLTDRVGPSKELVSQIEGLSAYLREQACKEVFEIVCRRGGTSALDLVRRVLDRDEPKFAVEAVSFLEQHGTWDDVTRIAALVERRNYARTGFFHDASNDYNAAANAILRLAKSRIADLFTQSFSAALLARLIAGLTNKQFAELSDLTMLAFMAHEDDAVRKAASLKSVLSLTKTRCRRLLETYTGGDQYRYYNVIHWLDLAVNTPAGFAKPLAAREATF
ncbi:DUF4062 domain-containing protein [Rhizobium sp. NZLR10]|uniref:DUF4062 domain-containing protein n=1 Tax=Rhizobium sp. NZLR10 TaxID=2731097 RepID=UPI001C82A6A9|nr:DUF4062 domain-containing protein [Rhizobium sp. NZLR10]MBX5195717.1 DUF4062 domain-containing protein [Rhizobium sp. NZLR10]